jgi:hypothetical protein
MKKLSIEEEFVSPDLIIPNFNLDIGHALLFDKIKIYSNLSTDYFLEKIKLGLIKYELEPIKLKEISLLSNNDLLEVGRENPENSLYISDWERAQNNENMWAQFKEFENEMHKASESARQIEDIISLIYKNESYYAHEEFSNEGCEKHSYPKFEYSNTSENGNAMLVVQENSEVVTEEMKKHLNKGGIVIVASSSKLSDLNYEYRKQLKPFLDEVEQTDFPKETFIKYYDLLSKLDSKFYGENNTGSFDLDATQILGCENIEAAKNQLISKLFEPLETVSSHEVLESGSVTYTSDTLHEVQIEAELIEVA